MRVEAVAPATVGNVICGFDVLGLAVSGPVDRVRAERIGAPGVRITAITGDGGELPRAPTLNTAAVAAAAVLECAGAEGGVEITLHKGLPLASGLGSSAASAVAAAVAVDALLESDLPPLDLLRAATRAEWAACGSSHPDNVAPALLGGLVLCRGDAAEADIVRLPVPEELRVVVLAVPVRSDTRAARAALGVDLPLVRATRQLADLAAFVHALHSEDWELLGRCLTDHVAERHRSGATPGFESIRRAGLQGGALGVGLSGAGPAVVALCRGDDSAGAVAGAMAAALGEAAGLSGTVWAGPPEPVGARVVAPEGTP